MSSETQIVSNTSGKKPAIALVILLLLAAIALLAIYLQSALPSVQPESAALSEFSAARALSHLQVISARPHPIGSEEHDTVRDYLVRELAKLGLAPETQTTIAVRKRMGPPLIAGRAQNVMARLKGSESNRAVLLACHYDSVPTSFGASDDGAGVVTLLETARALKAGPPLKHDVILLFTDGEEVGLLGADAFVAEHPWARDVFLFMNFEARGNSGPVLMFETSNRNNDLIREFSKGSPRPMASSFFYEIYRLLPNDTDFTVLCGLDAQGLNFAYLDGINHYHTALDNVEQINPGSLQHLGSYALALTRHFADGGPSQKTVNAVYFNLLGPVFIHYSGAFIIPLLVLTVLLFGAAAVTGFRTRQLKFFGVLWGFLGLLAAIIVSSAAVWLTWWLILKARPSFRSVPWGEPYHSNIFRIAFVLLALAATSAIYVLLRKRTNVPSLTLGSFVLWLILSVAVSVMLPGGSYLFTLPLLFGCLGLALVFLLRLHDSAQSQLVLAVAAVPGVVLWAPMIYNVFVALTLTAAWMVVVGAVLLFGLLLTQIIPIIGSWRWLVPCVLVLTSSLLVIAGIAVSRFDRSQPKTNNLFYGLNADTGKAVFASSDDRPDEWTAPFLATKERGSMTEFFPGSGRTFWKSPVPAAQLVGANALSTGDKTENGVRTLSVRITSPRHAQVLSIYAEPDLEILDASVNGKRAGRDGDNSSVPGAPMKNWSMQFYGLPVEGVEVVLKTKSTKPLSILIVDRSYGLPDIPGIHVGPRPGYMIPSPSSLSDVTLVAKSFTF